MNKTPLFALLALGALGAAGCGADYSGSYKGKATESGTVKISVPQTTDVAKNESPPRESDQVVTVAKEGANYTVKFANCELKGQASTPDLIVVKNECAVKV